MLLREKWHSSLTDQVILDAVERNMLGLDNPGFCLACGFATDGVEPDARRYTCEDCGAKQVYGAQELLLSLPLDIHAKPRLWPAGHSDGD